MPRIPLLILIALAACTGSPSPEFFGTAPQATTVAGRSFTVYRSENRVQVIRQGWASRAERAAIPEQMLIAVAQATGCAPVARSFLGDSGERRGRITCRKSARPSP